MTRMITKRQTKYLASLMSQHFGNMRKVVLKNHFGVDSTKDLTFEQAYQAIEKLVPDNLDKNYVAELKNEALESIGQERLI